MAEEATHRLQSMEDMRRRRNDFIFYSREADSIQHFTISVVNQWKWSIPFPLLLYFMRWTRELVNWLATFSFFYSSILRIHSSSTVYWFWIFPNNQKSGDGPFVIKWVMRHGSWVIHFAKNNNNINNNDNKIKRNDHHEHTQSNQKRKEWKKFGCIRDKSRTKADAEMRKGKSHKSYCLKFFSYKPTILPSSLAVVNGNEAKFSPLFFFLRSFLSSQQHPFQVAFVWIENKENFRDRTSSSSTLF